MSHHSTAIEGKTFTLDETAILLQTGRTPNRSIELREIYEIKSNARAMDCVIESLRKYEPLTEMMILRMHYFIGESTGTFPGEYKKVDNFIVGRAFQTTPASKVAYEMGQWLEKGRGFIQQNLPREAFFTCLAKSHIAFEKIHPFSDGNERTGRMILLYFSLLENYLPPPL